MRVLDPIEILAYIYRTTRHQTFKVTNNYNGQFAFYKNMRALNPTEIWHTFNKARGVKFLKRAIFTKI